MGLISIISKPLFWAISAILFGSYVYTVRYLSDRRVNRLGARAPVYQCRWPLGLDIPVDAVHSVRTNTVYEFWQGMFQKTGCYKIRSPTVEWRLLISGRLLFTADPENIKALLTSQFADYGKGPQFHAEWKEFLGNSIFTTDGKQWHGSRQLIRPMFMRERVADLEVIEEHLSKMIKLMGPGDGSMIRFDKLIQRFTLDAVTHFLFGISAGSLDDEQAVFGNAFDEVQRLQSFFTRAGPLRDFMSKKSFREGLKTMDLFMEPLITAVLEMTPSELEDRIAKSDTFIHALARFTRDRTVIRDQLVSLLLAGRDTTSATLSWAFLELVRNPRVVEKLRAEIATIVGPNRLPTYDNVKEMKYLTAIINETLRLYPPVPYNVRASLTDTTLPRGGGPDGTLPIGVPKATFVGYSVFMMQRDRNNYPPISDTFPYDPLEWVPERWATWQPKNWNFIPFNGGPRICIGQQFAMVEMGYTMIRIFQEFDRLVDYGNKVVLKTDILLTPGEGVRIGFVNGNGVGARAEKV